LVEFVLLLPGKSSASVRRKAASLLVQFYGGDECLIDEILEQRRVQVRMAEEEPDNPLRVFGQAVEEEAIVPSEASGSDETPSTTTACRRPPPPFRRTTVVKKFKGTTDEDLYVMELVPKSDLHNHSTVAAFERPLYKIGKSKEVEIRRHDLALDFSQGFWVSTLLILMTRCGDLEQSFHRRLQEHRCDVPRHRNGKELSKSREVFDLQKWAGEGEGVVVTQLLELAEDIVSSLDSPHRSLGFQEEAEAKRRRCMVDLELEKEKTLQAMADSDARKAEAEANARKAEAEADARKAEAAARTAEAEAEARKAEAEARKADARTRQLELLVGFGSEVQRTLVQQW
jgi:hypothetical protein